MSTTLALAAKQLREIADAIDAADDDAALDVYLTISPIYSMDRASQVATVDQVAARLGLTAEAVKKSGSMWYHEARDERDGVDLSVHAYIDPPPNRCVCGAECTHTTSGGVR